MAIKKGDMGDSIDESTDKAAAKIEQAVSETDDGNIRVELSDDDDDDDGGGQQDATRETRNERRRNRYREAQEAAESARAEAAELRRQYAETNTKLGQAMGYIDSMRQQPQQPAAPQADENDAALKKVYDEQERILSLVTLKGKNLTKAELDDYNRLARELDEQKTELILAKRMRGQQAQQQGNAQQNIEQLAQQAALRMIHSDVYGHAKAQAATAYADRIYMELAAEKQPQSQPEMFELLNQAMDAARVHILKTKPRYAASQAPSAGQRAKYAGSSAGGGVSRTESLTMTKEMRQMADAMYPKLPTAERYKKWAQGPGSKALQRKSG